MGGYAVNFTVYTMAMVGLICFAVFVYKKITDGSFRSRGSKFLSIEETMSLTPRKTLHIVRAGDERFLIASDIDRTTLISKLDDESMKLKTPERFKETPKEEEIPEVTVQNEETKGIDINPKEDKVVHLETINPVKKRVAVRQGTKVQRRRTTPQPQPQPEEDYRKHGFAPIKEMAKRINEL